MDPVDKLMAHETDRDFNQAQKALFEALRVSFRILQAAMLLIVAGFLCSGIFVVKQYESAIVTRFGKVVGTPADRVLGSGLHWAWPYPVDKVIILPTGRIQSVQIKDFWMLENKNKPDTENIHGHSENLSNYSNSLKPGLDGYIICGDVNIAHTSLVVRYQIIDPYSYFINVKDEEKLVKTVFNNAVIEVSSSSNVDDVLRTGIEAFRKSVEKKTQESLDKLYCGIKIQRVDIDRLTPPKQVKKSFDDVIIAEQEYSQKINEANSLYARSINDAQALSSKIISEAYSYQTSVIEESKADANYLSEILGKYKNNLEIFTFLAYQNTLKEILDKVDDKFIFSDSTDKKREIRILLNRAQKQNK